jgi:hypothetical protein
MKALLSVLALTISVALAPAALAEQSRKFGDMEVHYNAISTNDLTPEVARNYGIERSKNRGLLTVSVLRKNKLGVAEPIPASIKAWSVNVYQQAKNIDMREVKEGAAIYYLGEFRVAAPDTLKFKIGATPTGGTQELQVEYTRAFD